MPSLWQRMFGPRHKSLTEQIQERSQQLQLKLLETQLISDETDWVNPNEFLYDTPDFWPLGGGFGERVPINIDNRGRGEALPIYLTEFGLKRERDRSRHLIGFNEFAINAIENRISYIVGKGMQTTAAAKKAPVVQPLGDDGLPPAREVDHLESATQDVLDDFDARNEWGEMQQESVRRVDRDGEAFIRLFHVGQGKCEARFVEPEWVRSPADQGPRQSFGIETDEDDTEAIKGYWIVENPTEDLNPSFVEADQIVHIKLNTDRNAKRGVPTLLPVRKNLERADKLLRNMSTLAQIQATFALIRRHKNFGGSSISAYQGNADVQTTNPMTGANRFKTQQTPGQIIDTSQNTEYEFPANRVDASGLVGILQAELRAVAARLVMPEYMLTTDASNANYSSTLVAAAPAVKNFERLQAYFARHFGDGRYAGPAKCGLLWRVIRLAVEYGGLSPEALTRVTLQVEGPSLTAVDKKQETNRLAILNDKGILSDPTWAKMEGLDYEQEQRQGAKKPEPSPMPGQGLGDDLNEPTSPGNAI